MSTRRLVFGCAISLSHEYLFPSESLWAGACNCKVWPRLFPPAGGDQEMGAIYPGACQVVVTIDLGEGGKCCGAMSANKLYAFSKSWILQVVQSRPQPSESGVPMSPARGDGLISLGWEPLSPEGFHIF